jgi:antitoxin PrlF
MASNKECCKIDAVVSIDAKGQIVLPKDLRERAELKPNDKLALIGFERNGGLCCIVMLKADTLGGPVKKMLAPILKDALE